MSEPAKNSPSVGYTEVLQRWIQQKREGTNKVTLGAALGLSALALAFAYINRERIQKGLPFHKDWQIKLFRGARDFNTVEAFEAYRRALAASDWCPYNG